VEAALTVQGPARRRRTACPQFERPRPRDRSRCRGRSAAPWRLPLRGPV